MVTLPGTEGYFGVLAGHAPVISTLRPGVIEVKGGESGDLRLFVRGGFAEVDPTKVVVLAEEAISLDDFDVEALGRPHPEHRGRPRGGKDRCRTRPRGRDAGLSAPAARGGLKPQSLQCVLSQTAFVGSPAHGVDSVRYMTDIGQKGWE